MTTRIIAALALAAGLALAPVPASADGHTGAETGEAAGAGGIIFYPSTLPYPFADAVQVGEVLYLSGDIGEAGDGRSLVPGGIEPETHRIFERLKARLARHGLGLGDVFKCTVMLADMADWPAFNAIYAGYFEKGRYPARSAMGVNGLALGARVEMECLAHKPQS
ncbi:RidA family protein [Erythrobacter sp. sf7]|uniref:RidA family protein n=1 Tax=Erythrobacter fulvus TaxID=2987523 RepID=A0ABT5JS79_9SPHN|nr:RidA family protein [Erythrobacter fulvus]MDC8755265.1 RidA family protein [Erythrobacter fulvus]